MAEIFFYSNNNRELISEHTTSKRQALESELSKIEQWITQVEKNVATLDTPASLTTTKEVTEALMAASVYQKQIVVQMVSSNPEDAIALSLAASIEAYGKQLENINAWTEGGSAVVEASLPIIFEYICQKEYQNSYLYLEDLFQIVLIEFTLDAEEYGMGDLLEDDDFMDAVGIILEFTGSGNHHDSFDYRDQEEIIDAYNTVYEELHERAPDNSLMAKAFNVIEDNGGLKELEAGMSDEIYDNNGDINEDQYISPMLVLTILSIAASSGQISAEQWNIVMSGDQDAIEKIIDPNDEYDNLIEYIAVNQPPYGEGEGFWDYNEDTGYWDYHAPDNIGYEPGYLERFFKDFPPRELTEEEIEEVNRIGDQVKMLQQTLLYWLKICRDEQMAMAQNI
ncbi:hypothetical protein HYO33_04165 [Vibrio parahaemolyticus]|nr:hypothetical protein [Vibrio parahaemolyticus]